MANINKISVAGTIYDLQDKNAAKTVELTQAEYDGLAVKEQNTFYIISDAEGGDLSNYYTKGETDTLLGEKQPTLVSGTNIKTINNESLLGEGNIDLVETSAVTTSMSSTSTDTQVPSAKAVYDQLGGLKLVKLSQSQYDALQTKDPNTLFIIVN